MSDLARNALGSLLSGVGDPLDLRPDLMPTRPARGILGVLVRLGAGAPVEAIREALAGELDAEEVACELSACLTADWSATVEGYKATVKGLEREAAARRVKHGALDIVARLDAGETPDQVAGALSDLVAFTRPEAAAEVEPIGANVHELFLGTDSEAVPLGIRAIEPLKVVAGELCVLAARPGVGKSALLGTVALAAARAEWNVLLLSLEMPARQIRQRLLSGLTGVPLPRIMRPEGTELVPLVPQLAALPIGIRDAVGGDTLTVERIGAIVRGYRRRVEGNLVVLVDYLQLIRSRDRFERRHELIGHVCRELKAVALRESVPLIVAAQLNRLVEQRGKDARPVMSDLAESGDIEKNADQIVFVHRAIGESATHLGVAKYRMGACFGADVEYLGERCLFVDRDAVVRDDWQ